MPSGRIAAAVARESKVSQGTMALDCGPHADLFARAHDCLQLRDPERKLAQVARLAHDHAAGALVPQAHCEPLPIGTPGRPDRPQLVPPRALPKRGLGSGEGRVALVHAVAHIEFNAINLALDAVYRFRGMPAEYYADWI